MTKIELKPCPFCGSTVKIEWHQNNVAHVICSKCHKRWGNQVKNTKKRDELLAQVWNRMDAK